MTFTRDEFQKLIARCHRILRDNDKLSPEAAFDEFAKILFMKIQYEKRSGKSTIFTLNHFKQLEKEHNRGHGSFLSHLFDEIKAGFDTGHLFDKNETIRVKQAGFERIIVELEKYNFGDSAEDVKGIAFEELLGKTFRGKLGQFLTPRTIVNFMVKILDPGLNDLVCDPCCGSGGFLINVLQHIREKTKTDSSGGNLFGVDANPRMARAAKMNMVLHGDGHGSVYHHDGLLDIGGIFENRFDVILTNPPFGTRVSCEVTVSAQDLPSGEETAESMSRRFGSGCRDSIGRLRKHVGKPLLDLYDLGTVSKSSEVLFLERCLRLLKPGGRMGIVLPERVLIGDNMQKVRDYASDRAKLLLIVSLPRDVFRSSGATVKTGVVFLRKFTEAEARHYGELIRICGGVREEVEQRFNYKILVADVLDAGISSTGAPCENQLPGIASDFEKYRRANKLWE